ncbi:MAG: tRNA (adenine(22)-N(1))-methyltransferase [Candidatus Limivicinus sp.]|jgi:tRNA (adenine22-N1)-methyltransferase
MNKRLSCILSMIPEGKGVIDVGTDHAYLPTQLALDGYSGNIIASDINEKPLRKAVHTACEAGVENKITFLLCDGLEKCNPRLVDTIVIAGMGGDNICGILDRAEWCMHRFYRIILQPMTKPEILRFWLACNGFEFLEERLVQDSGEIYQIFSVQYGNRISLSDAELYTGSYELASKSSLFEKQLEIYIGRFEKACSSMSESADIKVCARYNLYRKILNEFYNMREKYKRSLVQ